MSIKQFIETCFNPKDVPTWFKVLNFILLLPCIVWPFIFFSTIFFFDNPSNFLYAFILFLLVNIYPLYLLGVLYLNYKLFIFNKIIGLIIPITVLILVLVGITSLSLEIYSKYKINNKNEQIEIDNGILGNGFKKVDNKIYFEDSLMKDIDPKSFEVIDWEWEKDKNHYYYQGKCIEEIDKETFIILDYHYSKDKNNVYYEDKIIKGADATTFKHIEGTQDGRDKNHCYNYGTRIDCKFIQKRNGL